MKKFDVFKVFLGKTILEFNDATCYDIEWRDGVPWLNVYKRDGILMATFVKFQGFEIHRKSPEDPDEA